MELLGHTRIFCVLFCTSVSLAAAATTSLTTQTPLGGDNTSESLWPDYFNFGSRNQVLTSSFATEIPVPYFDIVTDYVSISLNGYMSFGNSYSGTVPIPTKWPLSPKILAAYWTTENVISSSPLPSAYTYQDSSRLLNNVTRESSLIEYMKRVIAQPDFEPLLAFAVTWEDVRPQRTDQFPNDTATFQLLVATDSRVTYAIRGYEQVWQSPELGDQTYYSAAYSRARGERLKLSSPGSHPGPEVIPLGTKTPNRDPYSCVQKFQALRPRLNTSSFARPPCPCHVKQAAVDQQFTMSQNFSGCYQSDNALPGSSLVQLCCYNQYGILYNLTKEARVPLSTNSSDRTLQEAYETCCAVDSGLCRWFLVMFHRGNCVNNMTLLNTELPRFMDRDTEFTLKASPTDNLTSTFVHWFTSNKIARSYSASGVFNRSHGFDFPATSTSLSWRVKDGLTELRKLSYPQQLVFYMTDSDNISAQYGPRFELCLCQEIIQCNSVSFPVVFHYPSIELQGYFGPDTYERGNVNLITCDCKGAGTGRFCETPSNACDDCLITNSSICNTNTQDYCPPCPFGYHRDGTQCRDNTTTPRTPGKRDNHADSIYAISTAQVCIIIILSFLSTSLPWLQNSQSMTFNRVI